ncbi:MAG: hypothetical protein KDI68_16150 [Gammaproteobacteria bacterium]|nr:hypothetical protein [Gammaproteobacteria bacterium]
MEKEMGIFDFMKAFTFKEIDSRVKEAGIEHAANTDRKCQVCGRVYHLSEYPRELDIMEKYIRERPFMSFSRLEAILNDNTKKNSQAHDIYSMYIVDGMDLLDSALCAHAVVDCPDCNRKQFEEAAKAALQENHKGK